PTLFGETVADNLAFPYQIRKQVMDTQRVVTALNNVGLSERTLHQPIIELSGGERQRVALIRNILFLPKVLLLDEVTAGLDENNKQIVHAWLRQLNEQDHVTTIMITDRKSTRLNSSHVSISYAAAYTLPLHDALPISNPASADYRAFRW